MPIASALRSVLRWFSLASIILAAPLMWAQATGQAADGFDPNVNGNVYALVVQSDGKILIGGEFATLRPNGATQPIGRNNVARVLPGGSVDESFNANVNGQISAMVLQADGKIVIGGKFTSVNGSTRNRVARLNADGTLDAAFNPNVGVGAGELTPEVTTLALQADQKLLVGGGFTTVQPNGAGTATTRNRIARFNTDGSLDTTFDVGANNMVLALAVQADGKVIIGGGFTSLQPAGTAPAVARNRIARLNTDGSIDAGFNPDANNAVSAISVLPDGDILIGGSFTTLNSANIVRLARLDSNGAVDTAFVGSANGQVYVLKVAPDGRILVGGSFSAAGGGSRTYVARLLPGGSLDTSFTVEPNFTVYAIAAQADGSVVLGGGFTTVRGSGVTSVIRNHVARVSSTGVVDLDFHPDANGRLRAMAVQTDGKILVGGSFTSVGGVTHSGIVRLNADGSVDQSFNASVNGTVLAIKEAGGKIIIGGGFQRVNGAARFNLARLNADGSLDQTFETSVNNLVNALAVQADGKILAGGTFTVVRANSAADSVTREYIVRLNTNGSLDDSFKLRLNGAIQAMVVQQDGKVVMGGSFTGASGDGVNSVQRSGLLRLNTDGSVDPAFETRVNGTVSALLVQSNGDVVIGGTFNQIAVNASTASVSRFNIARVKGTDGAIDTAFDPSTNGPVVSLAQDGDKLLVGGFFTVLRPNGATEAQAVARAYIARFNADGTVDTGFNLNLDDSPGNVVSAIVRTSDNTFVIGGAFTSLGNVRRNRIARITNGAVDQNFNADSSTASGPAINSITTDSDGKVLAAGNFASRGGSQSVNLSRFTRDGFPDTSFTPTIDGPVYTTAQSPTKGGSVPTQRPGLAWLQSNGQLRPITLGATPALPTVVAIAIQPADDKVLVGGMGSAANSLIRFNANGTVDTAFAPAVTGTVYSIRVLSDNKILIAGEFNTVGGTTRNNIARLNADGTLDTGFNPNASSGVLATAVQTDGKILIGGDFTSLIPNGGATVGRNRLARLNSDGTVDTAFNPNANESVRAVVVQPDGKIVIGGRFTALQPNGATTATSRAYLARLNTEGTLDTAFDLKVDAPLAELALQGSGADTKILVGGFFSRIGGTTITSLARVNLDGTVDQSFHPNPNDVVQKITVQTDGKILIAGEFSGLDPANAVFNPATATPRNRSARLNADGTIDPSFNPNFNNTVITLVALGDGTILAGGTFNAIQPSGSLLVGGAFGTINGLAVNNLALFGDDGSISSTFQPNPNGAVHALVPQINGQLVVGGSFTQIAGTARNRLARFKADDTLDPDFNPAPDGDVFAVALQPDGKLLVGGSFSNIGGAGRANLARLNANGTNDSSFNPSIVGAVHSILLQTDGRILITREITGGNQLVRLLADGSVDASFSPANNGAVSSIALQADGRIVVGGSFTTIGGGARNNLARLNANGALDATLTAQPNGAVTALTLQEDGKILVGGMFNAVDALPRFGLARIAATTAVGDSFTSDPGHTSVTWTRSGGTPEVQAVIFERSTDAFNWSTLGEATRVAGTSNWRLSGLNLNSPVPLYVRAHGIVPAAPGSSAGLVVSQGQFYFGSVSTPPAVPVITSAGVVNAAEGSSFAYTISASGVPTSFAASGLPAGLTLNTSTGLISGTPTVQGTFSVTLTATNSLGSGTATLTLFVGAPGSIVNTGRVVNLSVLAPVSSGNPIIAGFVISGSGTQNILIRAVGPGLSAVGVTNGLATPNLKVFNAATAVIHESNSWGGSSTLTAEFARLGAFPLNATSADAAVILPLNPGAYTLHVNGSGTTGGTALAEVYDASIAPAPMGTPRLVNISARGVVSTAGQLVTGGFVITGTTPRKMLIRGIGPGLTGQGVTGALTDPVVTLHKIGTGIIAQNNNWGTPLTVDASYPAATGGEISAAATTTGAFSLAAGSTDGAILVTLAPGVYTAQVGGSGTTTGAAMVEVYEVP